MKDLGQLAKKIGVAGWHSMRKDQLVRALVRASKSSGAQRKAAGNAKRAPSAAGKAAGRSGRKTVPARRAQTAQPAARRAAISANGKSKSKSVASGKKPAPSAAARNGKPAVRAAGGSPAKPPKRKTPHVVQRLEEVKARRGRRKDLSTEVAENGRPRRPKGGRFKERLVLLVRDPFWLQVCWDLTRQSVQRAEAAMAEQWHTARPILRVVEVDAQANTTSTAERLLRDIEIHGGVNNWYVDVQDPPHSYRVEIGYLSANGKFYSLARSNTVTTPSSASSDALDEHWSDIAENYEKIYAQSGGELDAESPSELRDLFEERLRRPMSTPVVARFGVGADRMLNRHHHFHFEVDAEVIIYGATRPNARVTIGGAPVKLRPDGTFTVRHSLPDRRQVLPVVASSSDGLEQRTTVLAIERNTKVMEPVIREANE